MRWEKKVTAAGNPDLDLSLDGQRRIKSGPPKQAQRYQALLLVQTSLPCSTAAPSVARPLHWFGKNSQPSASDIQGPMAHALAL